MIDHDSLKKIESFINKELNVSLSDASIFKHPDGSYELFNKFMIIKESDYKFIVYTQDDQRTFSFLKNAVMWCTFKKRDKFYEMNRIAEIDMMLSSVDLLIAHHRRLSTRAKNLEDQLLYIAKLNEDKLKKQSILHEMNRYIVEARYWQLKKFAKPLKSLTQ
jgi:hypothetical protein